MNCQFCHTDFVPKALRTINPKRGEGQDIEVQTRCPKCSEIYYSFTDGTWTSLANAKAFIRNNNARLRKS